MRVAIVTGASAGLGWEFAKQLAPRREVDEIWLVARRADRLAELRDELIGAEGRIFALDLTDPAELAEIFEALEAETPTVTWLVNNAGFGKVGPFDSVSAEMNLRMIDLNVRALTEITQRVLPYCQQGSRILQVASSAGFAPLGNFAVYGATKAYVVNLANALATELKSRGITVTAVCPGPVDTEFQHVAGVGDNIGGKLVYARAPDVVRKAIADARKGRLNSVYGASIKTFTTMTGVLPRRLVASVARQVYKKRAADEE